MLKVNRETDALIIVDVQYDFLPGGALGVPNSDSIIPVVNNLIPLFNFVFTTQDWHPKNHISFKEQGGIWPSHCVKNTHGALIAEDIHMENAIHILKGTDPNKEAYSGFQGTDLVEKLQEREVIRVFLAGLTTDYCVKDTALDAIKHGFEVMVVTDSIFAVNVNPGDGENALKEMANAGAIMIKSADIFS